MSGKPEPLRRRLTAPAVDPDIGASELTEHDDDDEEAVATPPKQTNWAATLIAGGIAGGASRTSVAPLERIKILFQVQGISAGSKPVLHTSVTESLRSLVQRDGVRGLWKGNGLNCDGRRATDVILLADAGRRYCSIVGREPGAPAHNGGSRGHR